MNSSPEAAVTVQNLEVVFSDASGVVHALRNVTFSLPQKSFITLIGVSGSGKSTILRVLAGLITPTSGAVQFNTSQPRLGLVFQNPNLMPWRRVIENISLPLELQNLPKAEVQARAQELINLMGLQGFELSYPRDLSGGMAQRVAIARSLMQDPDLLLLDEPFGALDALMRERMADELVKIWHARRKTVLMVTHSIAEAIYLSDKVLVLSPRPGEIILELPVDLPRPRTPEVRYLPAFGELVHQLRDRLSEENNHLQ